ncbi:MAG: SsrA-binding protein SmpB [OCS116 cluster bacterium]|uniref:SsrA-binding protein n=1 Tax=OCS116 cluster bacterium TaxID=2030921 RepID=A0A2A4YS29_9PROT|nr:SsrA-binding protein SmpB [OCS116 cluster bacterium]
MAKKKKDKGKDYITGAKTVAENRKARYNYEVLETVEAGIMLLGSEVKSLRHGGSNIAESYASIEGNELFLINSHIAEYTRANRENHQLRRHRKLLLKRKEIDKMRAKIQQDGITVVPLKMYFNERGMVKLLLGLGKGKKNHDKRQSEKSKDWARDKARLMRDRG